MTFLRRYGYSAIGYCMITSAIVIEMSMCFEWLIYAKAEGNMHVGFTSIFGGLFSAGACMISFGAILGKCTPAQLMVMGIFETILFWGNARIVFVEMAAHDVG